MAPKSARPAKRLKQTVLTEFFSATREAMVAREQHSDYVYIQENLGDLQRSDWEETKCSCLVQCSRSCKNRRRRIECTTRTCNLVHCTNRPWTQLDMVAPRLQIRSSPRTGLGAFAEDRIAKGSIVREYVGEIIEEEEKAFRQLRKNCVYMMNYNTGVYIDAEYYGNDSRYFNHSCAPNCAAEEWTVAGMYRIGIVALRTIQEGEEISFNYGTDYRLLPCMCPRCTDT